MNKSTIRPAVKEEAPQIAELFMLAWPVDETIESQPNHYAQLLESMTGITARPETLYTIFGLTTSMTKTYSATR